MKKILFLISLMLPTSSFNVHAEVNPNFYVYLCFGQSNMEGNATPEAIDKENVDERFKMLACVDFTNPARKKGEWYTAYPPIVRQGTGLGMADYFGRTMVANLPQEVTVGVVDVAIGGTDIKGFMSEEVPDYLKGAADWLKNYFKAYDNDPYQRLVDMARIAQEKGVIKGILLHQGETNTGQADWPQKVKTVYERLLNDLGLNADETPLFVGEVVSSGAGGSCAYHNTVIAKVPSVIPTAHIISSEGCPAKKEADGSILHFTAQGYRIMGQRYAKAALREMGVEAEIQEPEQPKSDFEADQRFTSLEEIGETPFAIINETEGMAIFGSDNQNLKYDILANAFLYTNSGYLFRLEDSTVEGCHLLRLIKPDGSEYSIWGSPGYLNGFSTVADCSFILGLNNQNGQDVENGAVWEIEYASGKGFALKNKYTGQYLRDAASAKYDSPTYFTFCTLKEATDIKAVHQVNRNHDHSVYDLNGRRVNKNALRPGIYIKNNKKIIIN